MTKASPGIFGLVGEFRSASEVVGAARQLRPIGVTRWDIYGPAPLKEIEREIPPDAVIT